MSKKNCWSTKSNQVQFGLRNAASNLWVTSPKTAQGDIPRPSKSIEKPYIKLGICIGPEVSDKIWDKKSEAVKFSYKLNSVAEEGGGETYKTAIT